jgi:ribosomal protein S18 acetylase RimI-like enzyme
VGGVNCSIRRVDPTDVETVVAFAVRAWAPVFESFREVLGETIYAQVYPDWLTSQAAAVEGVCHGEGMDVFVAAEQDRLVGFVAVVFHKEPRSGEIDMIAVDPDFQRRGVASALTSFALDHIAARGFSLAIVATGGDRGHAPARRTYEKAGFVGLPLVKYYKQLRHSAVTPR